MRIQGEDQAVIFKGKAGYYEVGGGNCSAFPAKGIRNFTCFTPGVLGSFQKGDGYYES